MLFILLFRQLAIAGRVSCLGTSATPAALPGFRKTIVPTATPVIVAELLQRATTTKPILSTSSWGSNVCGWRWGDYDNIVECDTNDTCLWNSELGIVGCGNTAAPPYLTSCVGYNNPGCDDACSANPRIYKCDSIYRSCYYMHFPNSYYMPNCRRSTGATVTVSLTYDGVVNPIYLPRYLGSDGTITVKTQYPPGSTSSPSFESKKSQKGDNGKSLGIAVGCGSVGVFFLILGFCYLISKSEKSRKRKKSPSGEKAKMIPKEEPPELGGEGVFEMSGGLTPNSPSEHRGEDEIRFAVV